MSNVDDPTASSGEVDISEELSRYRLRRQQRYACVHVLLLSWKDSDIEVLGAEIKELARVFREHFNYLVWPYHIPSQDPQTRLQLHVAQFIARYGQEDNLIVVFYSGHGGQTIDRTNPACIWAAQRVGGATLDWACIQPMFLGASCDVAFILDCCYAGQAVRSRFAHNVEFLTATDRDQYNPTGQDSRWPSFTKVLCQELVLMLEEEGLATLPGLQRRMLRNEAGTVKQPFYFPFSSDSSVGAIRMKPWSPVDGSLLRELHPPETACPPRNEATSLYLRLFLFNRPDASAREALLRWMTRESPSVIDDIEVVERTITEATAVDDLEKEISPPGSQMQHNALPWLSKKAQAEADRLFHSLRKALTLPEELDYSEHTTTGLIEDISTKTRHLLQFLGDNFASFEAASRNTHSATILHENNALASQMAMRLTLLQEEMAEEQCRVSFQEQSSANQRFRVGKKDNVDVLVDYWYYDHTTAEAFRISEQRIARISKLLLEDKPSRFRILHGLGYLHETLHGRRFGLVYGLPPGLSGKDFCTLAELIRAERTVPLQVRAKLSAAVCDAVLNIHSIGWYHKAIRSDNILILKRVGFGDGERGQYEQYDRYDLENPYLIGFDCSRLFDADTWTAVDFSFKNNIYRHPDRWGRPRRFEKHHDIYALGLLILEIGFWKLLPSMDGKRKEFGSIQDPEKFRDILLGPMHAKLAHAAGSSYADAVKYCIHRTNWGQYESWEAQSVIRQEVYYPLSKHY